MFWTVFWLTFAWQATLKLVDGLGVRASTGMIIGVGSSM